ncbi:hypothetical protein ESCO_002707 [Escovopsis weberi]|uniref:Transcriptional regulator n=1 Tax=Escovopsis weberi TaxID=150374 RepID=A0A0M9VT01_ESCWE|nr:hypothetical protein ESCO_002707 [Escovopsis weberi]
MAPSAAKLKEALVRGTREVFEAEPDETSVNKVRKHVEEKLGLDEGFFTVGKWKQTSKAVIKEQVDKLLNDVAEAGSEPEVTTAAKAKEAESRDTKKTTNSKTNKAAARQTKGIAASDSEQLSELDDEIFNDSDDEDMSVDVNADDQFERPDRDDPKEVKSNDETTNGDSKSHEVENRIRAEEGKEEADMEPDEEDDYSDVIDDPAPAKGKKKSAPKDASAISSSKAKAKAPKTAAAPRRAKPAAAPDDPQEAEVKKLQSQLSKCGVRKLWHNELRQHGGDARAKIRHLKAMLADVGMDGRFSEAKAREIRELRELRADVEAAQEMNKLWGMTSGRRASRSKSKSQSAQVDLDRDSGDEANGTGGGGDKKVGEGEGEGEDEDEDMSFAARRRRAHADLAFLGDDSDSE